MKLIQRILRTQAVAINGVLDPHAHAKALDVSTRTVYRYIRVLRKTGIDVTVMNSQPWREIDFSTDEEPEVAERKPRRQRRECLPGFKGECVCGAAAKIHLRMAGGRRGGCVETNCPSYFEAGT